MKDRVYEFFKNHYYILTSILMFLSFPSFDIWFLKGFTFFAWISLVPLFIYIKGKNYKEIFFITFVTGFIGNLLVYNWIGHFGVGVGGGGGYILVLSFLIPSLTVFFVTKIILAEFLSRRFETLRLFIYPSVWIFIDWLKSIGFLAFPWTYWGYSQFNFTSFIQISSITGIMGVTFILIFTNYILSDFLFQIKLKAISFKNSLNTFEFKKLAAWFIIFLIIIIYGISVLIFSPSSKKNNLRVAIIQSCISPWEHWRLNRFRYLAELEYLTSQTLASEPDLIIWSESATLENISYNYEIDQLDSFERRVLEIARLSNISLLTGEIGITKDRFTNRFAPQNSAVLIDEEGKVVKSYSKINLVPFGEWFPYENWLPHIKRLTMQMGGSSFIPGRAPDLFDFKDKRFGVLICYEGIFYRLCNEYKKMGADFLVNITNDGWTDYYSGHIQHFSASVFRSVENGIWYVRAGNTGLTAFINPYGRIASSIPILKKNFLIDEMDFGLNHETFYSRNGDIFLYAVMIFIIVISIFALGNLVREKKFLKK